MKAPTCVPADDYVMLVLPFDLPDIPMIIRNSA